MELTQDTMQKLAIIDLRLLVLVAGGTLDSHKQLVIDYARENLDFEPIDEDEDILAHVGNTLRLPWERVTPGGFPLHWDSEDKSALDAAYFAVVIDQRAQS